MPRLKPPPSRAFPEDAIAPEEAIEIELSGDEPGDTEVEIVATPEVVTPEPKPEDDNPLQNALDAQKRAEELQRTAQRERDDALRQAREHEQELGRERVERQDAQYNSVLTAIAAEQAVLDKAEADYADYASAGDWGAAAKAQRVLSSATARLDRLEENKLTFDQQRADPPEKPAQRTAPAAPQAPLEFEQKIKDLPDTAKSWLRKHPEFMNDNALNKKISAAHTYLTENKGVQAFTGAYFDALDDEFGFKAAPAEPEPHQPQRRSMPVSAPVSRDVPTASGQRQPSGKMHLSAEERAIARSSFTAKDMTDAQKEYLYAQNKRKLQTMRANGQYPTPERN